MSVVGVGEQDYAGPYYNPAEIGTALSRRDNLNADFGGQSPWQFRFIFGSMTEMTPGQSITTTMTFIQSGNQTEALPKIFQFATEIVVGIEKAGTKKTYSLHNFTFDQVALSGRN
jgi:hypothetical protein